MLPRNYQILTDDMMVYHAHTLPSVANIRGKIYSSSQGKDLIYSMSLSLSSVGEEAVNPGQVQIQSQKLLLVPEQDPRYFGNERAAVLRMKSAGTAMAAEGQTPLSSTSHAEFERGV